MARLRWIVAAAAVGAAYGILTREAGSGSASPLQAFQPGRGRQAESPADVPAPGWRDVAMRTWKEALDDRLFANAAAVAFYMLLSLVPALAVMVSLYGLFADRAHMSEQLAPFISMMPAAAQELVREQAARLLAQPPGELSAKLVVGLALALWSATAATKALFDALNVIYDEEEKRSFFKLNAVALATTFGLAVLMLAAIAVIAVIPAVLAQVPFGATVETLIAWLRWPALFALTAAGVAALYRIGPSRRAAKIKWSLPGAALGAGIWMAASALFSWYAANFSDYSADFGSLASVVVFMTWLWLTAVALLMGAEFAAELEHQTARDTTVGAAKPMGARGANMADTVGAAQV